MEEQARRLEAQEAELRLRMEREKEAAEQRIWERLQLQNQVENVNTTCHTAQYSLR